MHTTPDIRHPNAAAFAAIGTLILTICLPGPSRADIITYKQGYTDTLTGSIYQGTEDTTLEAVGIAWVGSNANQNYGGRDYIAAGRNVNVALYGPLRSLVRFDVSSLLGNYSAINSVTLRLYPSYVYFFQPAMFNTLAAYSLSTSNSGWVEGAGFENDIGEAADVGVTTWNGKVQGSAGWAGSAGASTSGLDYAPTALTTTTFSATTALNTAYDFVLTGQSASDLINQWLTTANSGILLRSGNDSSTWDTNILRFWSSESANVIYRPELIVDYSNISAVPLPPSLLLLLSGLSWLVSMGFRGHSRTKI